ncbi:MAG: hypothetical protein A2Z27_05205 [candidate division Zixibacteria bacterium RBG_16_50_21]|nr:MAG: hypothetical protein A2Z27_05205 [candidate division Zixibacteria bacterium RBG_16_50_21]
MLCNISNQVRGKRLSLMLLLGLLFIMSFTGSAVWPDGGGGNPQYSAPLPPDTSKTAGVITTVVPAGDSGPYLKSLTPVKSYSLERMWRKVLLLYWMTR